MKKRKKAKKTTVRVSARSLARLELRVAYLQVRLRVARRRADAAEARWNEKCPQGHLVRHDKCELGFSEQKLTETPLAPGRIIPVNGSPPTVEPLVGWWWRVPYGWWLAFKAYWSAPMVAARAERAAKEKLLDEITAGGYKG